MKVRLQSLNHKKIFSTLKSYRYISEALKIVRERESNFCAPGLPRPSVRYCVEFSDAAAAAAAAAARRERERERRRGE